jgi:hypothetical protein
VRRFHLAKTADHNPDVGFWKNRKDEGNWYCYEGHFYKINEETKKNWLNNKFNLRLLEYFKKQKKVRFCDSAVMLSTIRWSPVHIKISVFRKLKRNILSYWLFPFIKKFSIKEGFRWYNSYFWYKEDNNFNTHLKWYLPKPTAYSALRYYSNWFFHILKKKKRKYKKFVNKRTIKPYVF